MKVSLIQMNMQLGNPDANYTHAEHLIRQAATQNPDVVCLPETWNVGFFPKENLHALSDQDGARTKSTFGALAAELNVNIVAGSVSNVRNGKIYNTAFVFDRSGNCVAEYDKTHLFTPMGEDKYFEFGDHTVRFELDGVTCGLVICYDIRFCELIRTMTVPGIEVLFVVSQWPTARKLHWQTLNQARAIENQCFVACTNSCGTAGITQYAGHSAIYNPWGEMVVSGGASECILTGDMDISIIQNIRDSINVYRDRRPALYRGLSD